MRQSLQQQRAGRDWAGAARGFALGGLAAALVAGGAAAPPQADARTFYVSPGGSDRRSGTSPARAWRTVRRVNRARLRPGDRVLLRGRATFGTALMPRRSGRAGRPIAFASYGRGRARLPRGIWFRHRDHLAFDRLALPGASLVGRGNGIALTNTAIARNRLGVYAEGRDWWIARNHVHHTGDSGLILAGDRMTVAWNRIEETGRDRGIAYGKHGIYLRVADARLIANAIRGFADNGISARYRNGTIERNRIDRGPIGIAWFQGDEQAGVSSWVDNAITRTTSAGIYVSPADAAGPTRESFVIAGNRLRPRAGRPLDLQRIAGWYRIGPNRLLR